MLEVFHHIRRPVVEYLEPSELHIALLNIYPAVGDDVSDRREVRLVLYFQLVDKEPDRHEIAVRQPRGNARVILGDAFALHSGDKVLYRHGREEFVAAVCDLFSVLQRDDAFYAVALGHDARDLCPADDGSAEALDLGRHQLVELSRSLLRVGILLDKRGLRLASRLLEGL